ncbi:hypothetical protein Hdeb2414_s0006g00219481 [Helianthus debilis subsp. tardiflorus]
MFQAKMQQTLILFFYQPTPQEFPPILSPYLHLLEGSRNPQAKTLIHKNNRPLLSLDLFCRHNTTNPNTSNFPSDLRDSDHHSPHTPEIGEEVAHGGELLAVVATPLKVVPVDVSRERERNGDGGSHTGRRQRQPR